MKHTLGKISEKTTSYGSLKDVMVGEKKVAFWEKSWPDQYSFLAEGMELEFDIVEKEKNGYKNYTAYSPKQASVGQFGGSKGGIAAAQTRKHEMIKESQDNKDVSIRLAAAMRDAVQLAICELSDPTANKAALATRILHWRSWLLNNHGDERDVIDPTK